MKIDFAGMKDIRYIYLSREQCYVCTYEDGLYRGVAFNGLTVYSPLSVLEKAWSTGWNGKPRGLDGFVECYSEIILAYIKQKSEKRQLEWAKNMRG